jgi:hypothetical protein
MNADREEFKHGSIHSIEPRMNTNGREYILCFHRRAAESAEKNIRFFGLYDLWGKKDRDRSIF